MRAACAMAIVTLAAVVMLNLVGLKKKMIVATACNLKTLNSIKVFAALNEVCAKNFSSFTTLIFNNNYAKKI